MRTLKKVQSMRTLKVSFQLITTTTSLHQKCLFSSSLLRQKKTFDVLILPMASKKITTAKIKNIFLSNYLRHITYGYQGLWGPGGLFQGQVGQVRLGQLHFIKFGQIRVGQVRLESFKDLFLYPYILQLILFVNNKMP